MTVDFIDRAFLRRMAEPVVSRSRLADVAPAIGTLGPEVVQDRQPDDPVVSRLLVDCPQQWERLAERVEAACAAGSHVIAVASRGRGEGCSTTVRGLARVLLARGRDVTCRTPAMAPSSWAADVESGRRPVLVDAGVWFPAGPLHRGRLARLALDCHAVVLVRRAERPPCSACERALAAIGLEVLGEVVTFAASADSEAGA